MGSLLYLVCASFQLSKSSIISDIAPWIAQIAMAQNPNSAINPVFFICYWHCFELIIALGIKPRPYKCRICRISGFGGRPARARRGGEACWELGIIPTLLYLP